MQGVEVTLLLAICAAVCVICVYTKEYAAAFLLLFFGDFLAIQGKINFGYQILGIYKELTLISLCMTLLVSARQSFGTRLFRILVMLFACGILAVSVDFRPFSALILAGVVGILIGESSGRMRPPITALAIVCFIVCVYQFVNVTEFADLWFYDFLAEKAGDEFLSTYHAYFRNDRLRPPGFLVSPSTFGFVFMLFSYLIEKRDIGTSQKMIVKILCMAGLLMIQTRALLIIFAAFEAQQRFLPTMRQAKVLLYYIAVLVVTLVVTILFGDDGSLVRILLFTGLFSDLASGIGWLPFSSANTGPVDSQFVSFVRAFGVLGIIYLIYMIRQLQKQTKSRFGNAKNADLAFLCVLLFVNIFQWSESSPGNLLGWLMLGYYYSRNRILIQVAVRRHRISSYRPFQNEPNSIRASL